jgi:ribonuclease HI
MYFDDVLNLKGEGAGVLLISPRGEQLKYVQQIHYKASNNDAEYEALIHGLRIAVSLGIKQLLACLRTMCSSRTGGWSLPCVMSD